LSLRAAIKDLIWRVVFAREAAFDEKRILAALEPFAQLLPRLDSLYHRLGDDHSRDTLAAVLSHRILGPQRGPIPLNNAAYWKQREQTQTLKEGSSELPVDFLGWHLEHYNLAPLGFPITLFCRPTTVHHIFMLEQYRYRRSHAVHVEAGDYVIDAGSCWGDAALYFASRAREAGRVAAFEFIPGNLQVLRKNLGQNESLAGHIDVIERPVWSRSGLEMAYWDRGPATVVRPGPARDADGMVASISLDDFVFGNVPPRADFIKMDVEGAEVEALQGARRVLTTFRPKLAISAYHAIEHLVVIPEFLDSLGLGYTYFVDHFTTHAEETVLFAHCARS
jgi:FkbM family methyltransferase